MSESAVPCCTISKRTRSRTRRPAGPMQMPRFVPDCSSGSRPTATAKNRSRSSKMSKTSPDAPATDRHRLIADFQPLDDSASPTAHPEIFVEDDRTGMHPVTLERAVLDHLYYTCLKDP